MSIEEMTKRAHEIAVEKGFWRDYEIGNDLKEEEQQIIKDLFISQKLLLIISEVTESMEAIRKSRRYEGSKELLQELSDQFDENPNLFHMRFIHHIKDTFEDELADTFIRLGDVCEKMGIDIDKFIKMKMDFNSLRQEKHDKNF